jgi:hypothetical protein
MNTITRRKMLLALSMVASASYQIRGQQLPKVVVYKDPACTCCGKWVAHLQREGFPATATDVRDITAIKVKYNVPGKLQSCHTALVGSYVIEGHVPASDIRRLLKERPNVAGLTVPGMPTGSPGMEGLNGKPYDVIAFDAAGKTRVYSTQQPVSRG